MNKVKIIFVANNLSLIGGSEKQLRNLINKLIINKFNVAIYDFSNIYPIWIQNSECEILTKKTSLGESKFIIPWGGTNIKTFFSLTLKIK